MDEIKGGRSSGVSRICPWGEVRDSSLHTKETQIKFYKTVAIPTPVSYTHLDVYKRQDI